MVVKSANWKTKNEKKGWKTKTGKVKYKEGALRRGLD